MLDSPILVKLLVHIYVADPSCYLLQFSIYLPKKKKKKEKKTTVTCIGKETPNTNSKDKVRNHNKLVCWYSHDTEAAGMK